jgi:O-antigen/teichoic acid export membrane protein
MIQRTIKTTKQIGLYAISAGIAGYLLSIYLVPILFGEEFRESVQCIGFLLIGVVPFCLSMAVSGYFAGTGRVRINLYSAILGFIVCMAADLLLIPSYGILGAAIASSISYISTVTFLLVKFHRD